MVAMTSTSTHHKIASDMYCSMSSNGMDIVMTCTHLRGMMYNHKDLVTQSHAHISHTY